MRKPLLPAATALATLVLLAGTVSIASAAVPTKQHKVPKDACALVTDAEVATLVPSANPGDPTAATEGPAASASCYWDTDGSITTLTVKVSKIPAPLPQIKFALKAEAHDPGSTPIKGLGSVAFQKSAIPPNSEVTALIGKLLLNVEFSGSAPATDAEKAATLVLAKSVAKKV